MNAPVVAARFNVIALSPIAARPNRRGPRHLVLRALSIIVLICGLLPLPVQAQFAQQGPKLVGTDSLGFNLLSQGYSVSLSGEGNTAIIGAPFSIGPNLRQEGTALLFTRSGGVWTQQQEIPGAFGSAFGFSVSLSADGNSAIIGNPLDVFDNAGYAAVHVRAGGVWIQQTLLANHNFYTESGLLEGISVSLSADGNTAIVGAPGVVTFNGPSSNPGPATGAALVWTRSSDGNWAEQAILIGTDINGMYGNTFQGGSVSISGDGNTAIVSGGSGAGPAAWVYTRGTDGGWTQQAILGGGGFSVSLSNDGSTAIVGNASGAVVYARSSTAAGVVWNQVATLAGTGATFTPFGQPEAVFSVSLSADGYTAMVGTSVFTRSEVGWTQQELPSCTGAVGDAAQGFSVALSADGHTALVGGPDDNSGTGAAWDYSAFVFPGTPGKANCHRQRTAGLARQYGGLNNAAATLGFSSVSALQDAVMAFCQL